MMGPGGAAAARAFHRPRFLHILVGTALLFVQCAAFFVTPAVALPPLASAIARSRGGAGGFGVRRRSTTAPQEQKHDRENRVHDQQPPQTEGARNAFMSPGKNPHQTTRLEQSHQAEMVRTTPITHLPPPDRNRPESGRNFLYWMVTWPFGDLMPEIRLPIITNVVWSALLVHLYQRGKIFAIKETAHFMLVGTLGFFLTFRAGEGFARCMEAKQVWDDILSSCRDIIRSLICARPVIGKQRVKRLADLTCAYAMVLEEYVMNKASGPQLDDILSESDVRALRLSENRPLTLVEIMAREVTLWLDEVKGFKDGPHYSRLLSFIDELGHAVTKCERLCKNSVPPIFSGFALRFVSLWVFTVPFALLDKLPGPALVFTMAVMTWSFFGLRELGVKASYPFQAGALNMKNLWQSLMTDSDDAVRTVTFAEAQGR